MDNRNFFVGLFVAIAIIAFISATLWLTGKQGSESTVNYSMFFEKNVGGLNDRSDLIRRADKNHPVSDV